MGFTFWHRWGYINTIHCCCFWVLQKKKTRKQGTYIFSFVFYFVYTFCMLLLFNRIFYAFSNIIFISTNYSILYCTFHSVFLVQWMHTSKKKCWENMVSMYITCYVHFYIILYIPTTHHNFSTVYILLFIVFGVWKWWRIFCLHIIANGVGIHITFSWLFYHVVILAAHLCWLGYHFFGRTWVPLFLASYFDGYFCWRHFWWKQVIK